MLQDPTTSATLFAPTNAAWARVPPSIDLGDAETLQMVLLFLLSPGQVTLPDTVSVAAWWGSGGRWAGRAGSPMTCIRPSPIHHA